MRSIIKALMGVVLAGVLHAAERPNIILVMADDQGWGDTGYNGHPIVQTPVMDAMAKDGFVFDRFYAAAPVCSPTRASVMTGRHPMRSKTMDHGNYMRPHEQTIAETLKANGYVSGLFGKSHIGSGQPDTDCNPTGMGFDEWIIGLNFFDNDPYLSHMGTVKQRKGKGSVILMDDTLNFLRKHKDGDKPMFTVVWFPSPHLPHREKAEGDDIYAGVKNAGYWHEITLLDQQLGRLRSELRDMGIADNTILWYFSDNGGLRKESSGGRARKKSIYEGGLRVPGLLEWPARKLKGRSDVPITTSDIYPTLLAMAGVIAPENKPMLDGIDVSDIILEGKESRDDGIGFWYGVGQGQATRSDALLKEIMEKQQAGAPLPHNAWRMRKDVDEFKQLDEDTVNGHAAWLEWPWKLHHITGQKIELYNLDEDPDETTNLAKEDAHLTRVSSMTKSLRSWMRSVIRSHNGEDYDLEQATHSQVKDKPNFIVVFTDDQGYQDLGCFGSPDIRTPRIDQMAEEGMRFTSFYGQTVCGPSRTALMTGCYPLRVAQKNNVTEKHPHLHSQEITIAEILKEQGYATGCFGKWDLAAHRQKGYHPELLPTKQGFDTFFGTPTSNDSIVNLMRNEEVVEQKADMATLTKRYTDEAIAFIRDNKEQPFFVYIPHTMPHLRLAASDQFKGKSKRGLYGDVMEEIDYNVGRLIDEVTTLGLRDNTYVIFTSDNGPWYLDRSAHLSKQRDDGGSHGGNAEPLRGHKTSVWEGGVRVPTVMWAPGRIPAGQTCDAITSNMDLLPTFTKLSGGTLPTDRVIDGKDISDLMHGGKAPPNPRVLYHYGHTQLMAVRSGDWKLHLPRQVHVVDRWAVFQKESDLIDFSKPLLYNLADDIGETTNLANKHRIKVIELMALAELARKDIGDYNRIGKNARFFDDAPRRKDTQQWLQP